MLVTTSAFAAPTGSPSADVASAVGGSGQVNVHVIGNKATLSGYVENAMSAQAARQAVLAYDEIDEVVDLISRN